MMSYKPEDFFISFSDFFAVILPGAILAFAFKNSDIVKAFDGVFPAIAGEAQSWIAFFVAAYVLGHVISISGGFLDEIYEFILKRIVLRYFRAEVVVNYERLKGRAEELMPDIQKPFSRGYANVYVQLRNTEAAIEIDRQQAVSRFFRSFAIVIFILTLSLLWKRNVSALLICLVLLMFSLILYSYQRWKRTRLTYVYFIALSEKQNAPNVNQRRRIARLDSVLLMLLHSM